LERLEWSDQLQREAFDDERGTVHDDRQSDHDQLHGHKRDKRLDLLLRGVSGEHGGGECQFQSSECDPADSGASSADEPDGDVRERAGGLELECLERGNQLQREAFDHERGPVHDHCQSNYDQLHGHGDDKRDDVLLRGISSEHGGGERQFQPGECDPASRTRGADESDSDSGEQAGGLELECLEWSDQLQREALDDERGPVYDYCQSKHDQLHEQRADERDNVLLCSGGGEHVGYERQFHPGECHTAPQVAVPVAPRN